ncbi:MAG: aspartyl/glutamyl-tRNA(asn/Gln) amidotransferase subunit C, aspartyl-tRNA(Asn)/glutamyl-tRNA (Gln) amidotransferase subunit C [Candidatus Gottesmanbacteria bacterium GW2011_GWA2_43_14]|uniref:Aspartyl/glutamyl-tRNA(Asn/Gln) amidotransferase subunit C n=1 Tax=Candidatus Gottesmanbacteria bacterium GW2011_GWA2_43_14 TaxID=1618443 RepID=A0A0G1DLI1_9BACT|nr:MAG: aspartyl/glutamyl-tRNA(asn/Gln) amidotransferase subunit C, aspartyl-tRNA(Asn)/glutamyl-tRNA (Gln) amidotransferase subunit C [Candidatus Gottesmanbacteria bacterium GW2011_GWA2_43_14]
MDKASTKLTTDEIKKLAKLANLKLTEAQIKKMAESVSSVLSYVSQLKSLNTTDTEETSQVTGQENVFRDDVVDAERMLSQAEALSNSKNNHNGYFMVKAIFEEV